MTSIVHSRILRSKEFRSPFQCHMIRNKKRGIFPLCQAFEQLSQASCSCDSDCITLELSRFLSTNPFPAGPTAFYGASNTQSGACHRTLPFFLHIACSPDLMFACFLSFMAHPYITSSECFSHRESSSPPLFPPSANLHSPHFNLV